jgi:hypothetical protein
VTVGGHHLQTSRTGPGRLPELDVLKTVLVAWIIFGHALLGYVAYGGWEYAEVHEVTFGPTLELVLSAVFAPSALVVVGTLFLVAGLFLPGSLARHGYRAFVVGRLLRLGLPYLAYALLLWPLLLWLTYRAADRPVPYRWIFLERPPFRDAGALWFAGVLLLFSLGYAALVRAGLLPATGSTEHRTGEHGRGAVQARHVLAVTAAVAVGTYAVRLWLPARGSLPGDLHLWEWPSCLGLLTLGVLGARRGLLGEVPEAVWRGSGRAVVAAALTLPVVAVATGAHDVAGGLAAYLGGWTWQALYAATVESVLVVNGSLWLLGIAQRRFHTRGPVAAAAQRSAFAAYIAQGPVLLGLAVALRPLPVPALAKAVVVGAIGVVASFSLGWVLVSRTRLGRIL